MPWKAVFQRNICIINEPDRKLVAVASIERGVTDWIFRPPWMLQKQPYASTAHLWDLRNPSNRRCYTCTLPKNHTFGQLMWFHVDEIDHHVAMRCNPNDLVIIDYVQDEILFHQDVVVPNDVARDLFFERGFLVMFRVIGVHFVESTVWKFNKTSKEYEQQILTTPGPDNQFVFDEDIPDLGEAEDGEDALIPDLKQVFETHNRWNIQNTGYLRFLTSHTNITKQCTFIVLSIGNTRQIVVMLDLKDSRITKLYELDHSDTTKYQNVEVFESHKSSSSPFLIIAYQDGLNPDVHIKMIEYCKTDGFIPNIVRRVSPRNPLAWVRVMANSRMLIDFRWGAALNRVLATQIWMAAPNISPENFGPPSDGDPRPITFPRHETSTGGNIATAPIVEMRALFDWPGHFAIVAHHQNAPHHVAFQIARWRLPSLTRAATFSTPPAQAGAPPPPAPASPPQPFLIIPTNPPPLSPLMPPPGM